MGRMQADEMADALPRRQALEWHLAHNHYPPVSLDFVDPAESAIEAAEAGEWDRNITMPNALVKTASEIVEGLHLESFMEADDE